MKVYYDKDAKLKRLKEKKTIVIGYGSQGHAHALNLRDSGMDVTVGLRKDGASWKKAKSAGLKVVEIQEGVSASDVVMILVPDEYQGDIYSEKVAPYLKDGAYLGFAHGFNIHYGQIAPPSDINVFMAAPKGPGHLVRHEYTRGNGVPTLIAVHQDPSGDTKEIALAYASSIGGGKAGIIETNFMEETETDLFGEQAVLCGGVTSLITAGFETLVEAGYAPEMAYFECLHEMKLIVDLFYEGGISNMRYSISNTAQFGDLTRGQRVITEETKKEMKKILSEIQSGEVAREWIIENKAGRPVFNALTKRGEAHPREKVGKERRDMMPWLSMARVVDQSQH